MHPTLPQVDVLLFLAVACSAFSFHWKFYLLHLPMLEHYSLVPSSSVTFMTPLLFQPASLLWKLEDEIKRCLLLGRKAVTNLDSILKSRDISLLTKVHVVKAMVFPIVMYGCESWTIKKAERRRIDAFELWCWRRLLRVPWTARRSNQSILKKLVLNIHWKDWCWSWSSNTLTTWCKEQTH